MIFRNLKVEIGFHTTAVNVRRHRVPHTARSKFRHTHLQLASGQYLINQHLIDITVIGAFQRTHFSHHRVFFRHFLIGIVAMGRYGIEVELSRTGCILTLKSNFTVARTQVEGFFIVHLKYGTTRSHYTRSANVEDTHFTTGQEVRCFQRVDSFQWQYFTHRHSATHYHTIIHGIYHIYFVRREYLLYKEIATDSFCIIAFRIFRMCSVANFIVRSHDLLRF